MNQLKLAYKLLRSKTITQITGTSQFKKNMKKLNRRKSNKKNKINKKLK
jgi:hypothetical protein